MPKKLTQKEQWQSMIATLKAAGEVLLMVHPKICPTPNLEDNTPLYCFCFPARVYKRIQRKLVRIEKDQS